MAGRATRDPRPVPALSFSTIPDLATQRALEQTQDAIQKLQATRSRDVVTTDLVIGTNRVRHGLGRPVIGFSVTKTYCTIAYADAINLTNPRPDREVWIDVVGSDQTGARIEVW